MAESEAPFPAGKLPAELLADLLRGIRRNDPRVLIGPRVGTDAAAIDMGGSILIVKSDPITFVTDDAGWYLVNVNANDIACMGGTPRWLLVTALLPETSTTRAMVSGLFASLSVACEALGITLVGGHTEVTIGLDRPILVGSMLGETTRERLLDPETVREGDALVLCKGIAIEGTALLARQAPADQLTGVPAGDLERSRAFLTDPGISVVAAAHELQQSGAGIRAMHDPTEGGLATALREVSSAAGLGLSVDLDRVHVYEETQQLCDLLKIDPLGLISSGALLAAVSASTLDRALDHMQSAGIPSSVIGTFMSPGGGIAARQGGSPADLPEFEVDEIARYFSAR